MFKEMTMTKLVNFLAQLGQDSRLSRASGEELQIAMERAGLTAAERSALVDADRYEIEMHAGAVTTTCCYVFTTEESDEEGAVPAPQMRTAA
jgi:hypothetical protein